MLQNVTITKEMLHQPSQEKKCMGRIHDHLWQWSTNERLYIFLEVAAERVEY